LRSIIAGFLGGVFTTWTLIDSVQVAFQPAYVIIQMPNECTKADQWSYEPPVQEIELDALSQLLDK